MKHRVQALLVVPQQPVNDLDLSGSSGFKSQAMQTLHLQRAEHGLAARVIPAIAPSTHRADNPVALKNITKVKAGVLAPAITMEQQSLGLQWMTFEPGPTQHINHQTAFHALVHRPTHDLATE